MQRELEHFAGKKVVVSGMRQMFDGQDSVVLNPAVEITQFVVWVDSVACASCRINQMFEYDEIIDFSKKVREGFLPIFIFSPPHTKLNEAIQSLQVSMFDYPVFIDENQAFPAANPHIPADNRFHTFLIDKNGKVVLVGDPVNNPALWELYKTTITTLIENGGVMPEVVK
ncbi:MAG: hypothetical protein LBR68_01820 [Lachnoclostridium sp.]|nr:hypothetical protein [Lachnoclostridium sp.]